MANPLQVLPELMEIPVDHERVLPSELAMHGGSRVQATP